jgi:hypothetical protein
MEFVALRGLVVGGLLIAASRVPGSVTEAGLRAME